MNILVRILSFVAFVQFGACVQAQQILSVPRADGVTTPLIVYEPATSAVCAPLALISHGVGGSEKAMPYLGAALSKDGWRVLIMGHKESGIGPLRADMQALGFKQGLVKLVTNADAYSARFLDIDAAIKWSEQRCHAPYKALLGHSMGAMTVMLDAGAQNKLGIKTAPHFDAYVALSPQGPGVVFPAGAWQSIRAPMLLITGTRDQGLDGDYHWREQAFNGLAPGCRWLAVIDDATHLDFGGLGKSDKKVEAATAALTIAFLDGLRGGHCATPPTVAGVKLQTK